MIAYRQQVYLYKNSQEIEWQRWCVWEKERKRQKVCVCVYVWDCECVCERESRVWCVTLRLLNCWRIIGFVSSGSMNPIYFLAAKKWRKNCHQKTKKDEKVFFGSSFRIVFQCCLLEWQKWDSPRSHFIDMLTNNSPIFLCFKLFLYAVF